MRSFWSPGRRHHTLAAHTLATMCALFILAAACALALAPAGASVTQRTPAPSSVGGPARAPARAQPAYDARRARPHGRRAQLADETTGAVIATVVGTGTPGCAGDGGAASGSTLDNPTGVALDAAGNLYIADAENFRVRMVSASTGVISTLAGIGSLVYSGDGGPASSAGVYQPWGIAVDAAGNVYFTVSARVCSCASSHVRGTDRCVSYDDRYACQHTHSRRARSPRPALRPLVPPAGRTPRARGQHEFADTDH